MASAAPGGSARARATSPANTYTEVRKVAPSGPGNEGFCSTLCTSCGGILLFFLSLLLLGWNEQNTVCVDHAYTAAGALVETLGCDDNPKTNSGKVAHISCPLHQKSLPTWSPRDFGINYAPGIFEVSAVKVEMTVSMYQCVERKHTKKEKRGEEEVEITTYSYEYAWSAEEEKSAGFKAWKVHDAKLALDSGCGPDFSKNYAFSVKAQTKQASSLWAGNYDLSSRMSKIPVVQNVPLKAPEDQPIYVPGYSRSPASIEDGSLYGGCIGRSHPEPGCLKLTFRKSTAIGVSAVGKLKSNMFGYGEIEAWSAPGAWMCPPGYMVDIFMPMEMSARSLMAYASTANTWQAWFLRFLGVFLACIGVKMFFYPLEVAAAKGTKVINALVKSLPGIGSCLGQVSSFLGNMLTAAVGMAVNFLVIGIALPCCFLVMSVMYAIMRPWLGIPMLLCCIFLLGFTVNKMVAYAKEGRKVNEAKDKTKKA
jgi:hypothetical protein